MRPSYGALCTFLTVKYSNEDVLGTPSWCILVFNTHLHSRLNGSIRTQLNLRVVLSSKLHAKLLTSRPRAQPSGDGSYPDHELYMIYCLIDVPLPACWAKVLGQVLRNCSREVSWVCLSWRLCPPLRPAGQKLYHRPSASSICAGHCLPAGQNL